jgi:hypothetical protein
MRKYTKKTTRTKKTNELTQAELAAFALEYIGMWMHSQITCPASGERVNVSPGSEECIRGFQRWLEVIRQEAAK